MRHLGDITKLNGAEIPVVDCITGGSPCQDLSVAGKRAGLDGERSGLFMEQIRIVKEMRKKEMENGRTAELVRPRWMVWENVPGAFSSNGGKDFQAVLTEIVRIVNPECPDVPMPKDGKWSKAGCLYDELGRWSVAWRVHDAQFWGVPQRRKRIALVADFGGMSAPEILFERKGVSRDSEPSGKAREETAGTVGSGAEGASGFPLGFRPENVRLYDETATTICNGTRPGFTCGVVQNYVPMGSKDASIAVHILQDPITSIEKAPCISAGSSGHGQAMCGVMVLNDQGGSVMAFAQNQVGEVRVSPMSGTLNTNSNATGRNSPLVLDAMGNGDPVIAFTQNQRNEIRDLGDIAGALAAEPGVHQQTYVYENHSQDSRYKDLGEVSETVSAKYGMVGGNNQPLVVSSPMDTMHDQQTILCGNPWDPQSERVFHGDGAWHSLARNSGGGQSRDAIHTNAIVRRLTPLECERLQGFPDGWTDIGEWTDTKGKKHKEADSPRYKALGNSIALPFWFYLLRRISATYERPATLGSLFDGIGGFPLCWERCNGKGTAVWASEIEEFPIAVTKKHFPEEEL